MGMVIEASGLACGATVRGIDMTQACAPTVVAELEAALVRHGVLVFRDQRLEPRQLADFSQHFGVLQPHVQRAYQHPQVPEIVVMTNRRADGSFDEAGARRGAIEVTRDGWHSDLSYDPVPAKATLLHALELPAYGGNTCFTNAATAYAQLADGTKRKVAGLRAEFNYGGHQRNKSAQIAASALDAAGQAGAHAVHPVINVHVESGVPAIYVNPLITTRVQGVSEADSEAILNELFDALDQQEFRFEHVWKPGDTLLWDNRGGIMHTGRLDYPRNEARRFIRTTVTGSAIQALHESA
jgi:taurine dioxygenase